MQLLDDKMHDIFNSLYEITENEELEFKGVKGGFPGCFGKPIVHLRIQMGVLLF